MKKVLVVDDDPTVREVVSRYLSRDGHEVIERSNGTDGLAAALSEHPDLVVLDLMMPGMDGLAVCRELRLRSRVPVIMLTALGEESDRVVGLEYGADDYVTKPFSPRELALRVAGVLRRSGEVRAALPTGAMPAGSSSGGMPSDRGPEPTADGDLIMDPAARTVTRNGLPLQLTIREFDLLAFFLAHRGQVFSRAALMEQVWGWTFGDESTVTVHVRRLREKIEPDPANPHRVVTVWGIGYRYDSTSGNTSDSASGRGNN
ncbi:DNA-binding response OmpR family regulator [Nakamurella sp. UYEF19]|uniref:response regulator transcription factor n=1 Tax=Nakamurella sp. UYEF19 TaxID=1756392 RepID=UPI00339525B6